MNLRLDLETEDSSPSIKIRSFLIDSNIDLEQHYEIAKIIVSLFQKAIEIKQQGHSEVRRTLMLIRKLSDQLLSKDHNYVSWETQDNCEIKNIVLNDNEELNIEAWKSNNTDRAMAFTAKIPTPNRKKKKEASGLPPNFIHSLDANI